MYLTPSVFVTRSWNQIIRVSNVIRVAELTYVSIILIRSQVIREALELYVAFNLTQVSCCHLECFNYVTS